MKKMISRRNFLKAAALAGSAMALTACGGKGSAGDEAAAAVAVDGPVEFPLAETVTLTGTTNYPAGSESEPNNRTIFKRLEESTNVHIEWTAIQSDQWGDKISLNMSNPNTLTDFGQQPAPLRQAGGGRRPGGVHRHLYAQPAGRL